ncbi:uncharacterized protein Os02g0798501-like [Oryza glaberrima]|uniref:uncharacterized protein Os02g0798501-like n=1 Tax=Oryza glaberrima TaxID=4538 RepID=UPI00224BF50D|nr:uncharacterized protein Os02g0798501-like [Oryza glaberrima]
MAQNKTIAVALLLATLVAVMAEVPPTGDTLEEAIRSGCKEDCSDLKKKAPIEEKQCVDFCFIKTKYMLDAHKEVTHPTADRYRDFCNKGCNTEYKEDPATSKKCAESCDVDAKELAEFFANLRPSDLFKQ